MYVYIHGRVFLGVNSSHGERTYRYVNLGSGTRLCGMGYMIVYLALSCISV